MAPRPICLIRAKILNGMGSQAELYARRCWWPWPVALTCGTEAKLRRVGTTLGEDVVSKWSGVGGGGGGGGGGGRRVAAHRERSKEGETRNFKASRNEWCLTRLQDDRQAHYPIQTIPSDSCSTRRTSYVVDRMTKEI